jgi:hypothetical protein
MVAGSLSKDVWVVSEEEVVPKTLLGDRSEVLRVSRPPGDVPSRIADHLYWLGRYAERMEQTTRVLRMLSKRLGGEGSEQQMRELRDGLRLAQEVKLLDERFDTTDPNTPVQEEIKDLMDKPDRCDGVSDLLEKLRFNAAAARDRLSDDTWRLFNQLQEEVAAPLAHGGSYAITAKLDRIILDMAAFSGMQSENMVQGHGWRFLEMGRRIERGTANATFLDAAVHLCETDEAVLVPLLEIFDSTMTPPFRQAEIVASARSADAALRESALAGLPTRGHATPGPFAPARLLAFRIDLRCSGGGILARAAARSRSHRA